MIFVINYKTYPESTAGVTEYQGLQRAVSIFIPKFPSQSDPFKNKLVPFEYIRNSRNNLFLREYDQTFFH